MTSETRCQNVLRQRNESFQNQNPMSITDAGTPIIKLEHIKGVRDKRTLDHLQKPWPWLVNKA